MGKSENMYATACRIARDDGKRLANLSEVGLDDIIQFDPAKDSFSSESDRFLEDILGDNK